MLNEVGRNYMDYTLAHNTTYGHAIPLHVNLMSDVLMKNISGPSSSISVYNAPLPFTHDEMVRAALCMEAVVSCVRALLSIVSAV